MEGTPHAYAHFCAVAHLQALASRPPESTLFIKCLGAAATENGIPGLMFEHIPGAVDARELMRSARESLKSHDFQDIYLHLLRQSLEQHIGDRQFHSSNTNA